MPSILFFAAVAVMFAVFALVYFTAMKRARWLMDSPWFWGMIFSGIGLANLLLIGPKYDKREAGVELRYIARERAVQSEKPEVNGSAVPTPDELSKDAKNTTAPAVPSSELIVSHTYLAVLIGAVFLFSTYRLCRQIEAAKLDSREAFPDAETVESTVGRRS